MIAVENDSFLKIKGLITKKKSAAAEAEIRKSFLAKRQYANLLDIALESGASIEVVALLREKAGRLGSSSQYRPQGKPQWQESKNIKTSSQYNRSNTNSNKSNNSGNSRKTENSSKGKKQVIGFSGDTVAYCVFDAVELRRSTITLSHGNQVVGFVCPYCKAEFVSYKNLNKLIRNKKLHGVSIKDISEIAKERRKKPDNLEHRLPKAFEKEEPVSTDTQKKKKADSTLITLVDETPTVCECGSTNLTYKTSLPYPTAEHCFSGYYCGTCKNIMVKKNVYDVLKPEVRATLIIKKKESEIDTEVFEKLQNISMQSRNYKHWWGKALSVGKRNPNESFIVMEGTGKLRLSITLGIDFGASTTKVTTFVSHGPRSSIIDPIAITERIESEKDSGDFLVLSQIQLSKDGRISMADKKYTMGERRQYFKSILVNESAIEKDPDEIYYAVFFIANLLNAGIKFIKNKYRPEAYERATVNVVLGMPVSTTVGVLPNLFKNILALANELKDYGGIDMEMGVLFDRWKRVCNRLGPGIKELKWYLDVQPEVYSEVLHLFMNTAGPGRRALIVDIGSSTLDIAFIFHVKPTFPFLYIPIAEVLPIGVEVVSATLRQRFPDRYTSLQAARQALSDDKIPASFTKEVRLMLQQAMNSIYSKIRFVEEHFQTNGLGDEIIPIYFFGGGRQIVWYKNLFASSFKNNEEELKFNMPKWMFAKNPKIPDHLLHRFQVAIGLAEQRPEFLPLRALPQDFDKFWDAERNTQNFSLLNAEELQANLYGR